MTEALTPLASSLPPRSSHQLLRQIADALGVGVEAFQENPGRHLFHTAEDGTRWLVIPDAEGQAVVQQTSIITGCPTTADVPVAQFLAADLQTPQGQALEALINNLLRTCLR